LAGLVVLRALSSWFCVCVRASCRVVAVTPQAERRARAEAEMRAERDVDPDGRPGAALAPMRHEGRDGLPEMPAELVTKDEGATALCLAAMGLHLGALDQFLKVASPLRGGARTPLLETSGCTAKVALACL
jgi:hypothetical protein